MYFPNIENQARALEAYLKGGAVKIVGEGTACTLEKKGGRIRGLFNRADPAKLRKAAQSAFSHLAADTSNTNSQAKVRLAYRLLIPSGWHQADRLFDGMTYDTAVSASPKDVARDGLLKSMTASDLLQLYKKLSGHKVRSGQNQAHHEGIKSTNLDAVKRALIEKIIAHQAADDGYPPGIAKEDLELIGANEQEIASRAYSLRVQQEPVKYREAIKPQQKRSPSSVALGGHRTQAEPSDAMTYRSDLDAALLAIHMGPHPKTGGERREFEKDALEKAYDQLFAALASAHNSLSQGGSYRFFPDQLIAAEKIADYRTGSRDSAYQDYVRQKIGEVEAAIASKDMNRVRAAFDQLRADLEQFRFSRDDLQMFYQSAARGAKHLIPPTTRHTLLNPEIDTAVKEGSGSEYVKESFAAIEASRQRAARPHSKDM